MAHQISRGCAEREEEEIGAHRPSRGKGRLTKAQNQRKGAELRPIKPEIGPALPREFGLSWLNDRASRRRDGHTVAIAPEPARRWDAFQDPGFCPPHDKREFFERFSPKDYALGINVLPYSTDPLTVPAP